MLPQIPNNQRKKCPKCGGEMRLVPIRKAFVCHNCMYVDNSSNIPDDFGLPTFRF